MSESLGALFLLAAIIFACLYIVTKSRMSDRVQNEVIRWRDKELESQKQLMLQLARGEAKVELEQWKAAHEVALRQDAIQRSQAVTIGKVTEHIVPYLPGFRFNPKDVRFLGTPIDLVVFDGLCDGGVKRIVFVEVKTGSSALSGRERLIRDAVHARSVEWLEFRPNL
jgi:predicted Holliday junction resolvase-like endonuclease